MTQGKKERPPELNQKDLSLPMMCNMNTHFKKQFVCIKETFKILTVLKHESAPIS